MPRYIEQISVDNFKSIKQLQSFPLTNINILIGANGASKSNFIKLL